MRQYDTMYHEDLQTANMLKNHHLAKSHQDAGWAQFLSILAFKAANAGKQAVAVPPAYTSQTCSGCGVLVAKGLSIRWHECSDCGTSLHRDHNAAVNILALGKKPKCGRAARSGANVARWGARSLKHLPHSCGGVSSHGNTLFLCTRRWAHPWT